MESNQLPETRSESNLSHQSDSTAAARLLVAGDLCARGRVAEFLTRQEAGNPWRDIREVTESHDLCVVNLETPLTHSDTPIAKSGPHLRAEPGCAFGIRAGGFTVATLANNHILDMGERGLIDTLQACHAAGLNTVGAGRDLAEAARPLVVRLNGLSVAILTFAEHEFSIATDSSAGAWPLDIIDNHQQISAAREEADFVLVILHGGNEGYPLPSPRLAKTCRFFADSGADAIVCHHAHISSGTEVWHGVPIMYGTGNFLFDSEPPQPESWYKGYMVSFEIRRHRVDHFELIPYVQCREEAGVRLLDSNEAESFRKELEQLSEVISDPDRLESSWQKFCNHRQRESMTKLLSMNRVLDVLLSRNLIPLRLFKRRFPVMLNLLRCQAHHDVLIETLEQLSLGNYQSNGN